MVIIILAITNCIVVTINAGNFILQFKSQSLIRRGDPPNRKRGHGDSVRTRRRRDLAHGWEGLCLGVFEISDHFVLVYWRIWRCVWSFFLNSMTLFGCLLNIDLILQWNWLRRVGWMGIGSVGWELGRLDGNWIGWMGIG